MNSHKLSLHIGPYTLHFGVWGFATWLGFALALGALAACWLFASPAFGLGFALAFSLVAVARIEVQKPVFQWLAQGLWLFALLTGLCVIAQAMVGRFTFFEIGLRKPLLNLLCCVALCAGLMALMGSWRCATTASGCLLLILAVVNGYVYLFRDRELAILDIFTASTALKVAQQYNFTPTPLLTLGTVAGILALYFQVCLPKAALGKSLWGRLAALGAALLAFGGLYFGSISDTPLSWSNDGSAQHGTFLNLYLGLRDAKVRAPALYSPERVDQLAQNYPQAQEQAGPDILVIMNEAFFHPDVYPQPLHANIPVTPFWDSLEDNTLRGYALSSVYGGNTANSEFEFLTGSTMAFLPTGAVPYTQYISQNFHSLAWTLKSYGYSTFATHNYDAKGWSRDTVYPLLGFDRVTFLESYPQKDLIRGFVSDREQYEYLLTQLENQDTPTFLFAVTMQNHGGYTSPSSTYRHTVSLAQMDDPAAEQYLSLLNESDKALQYLLTALEARERDTLVLFFGDHQPKLDASFYEALNGGKLDTLEAQMRQYAVPFLIWANYPLEEKELGYTSLNYLGTHLMEAAGLTLSPYQQYLAELEEKIPAMNHLGYWSNSQQAFLPYAQAQGEERDALQAYECVQYNHLFDKEASCRRFFALPESS